jgi:hypothetical protein
MYNTLSTTDVNLKLRYSSEIREKNRLTYSFLKKKKITTHEEAILHGRGARDIQENRISYSMCATPKIGF